MSDAANELKGKIAPMLENVRAAKAKGGAKGMAFLEVKGQLLLNYLTYLAFFVLLKSEGRETRNHAVVTRLAHIKLLLEKLRPLDKKLEYQVTKALRMAVADAPSSTANPDNLQFKPRLGLAEDDGPESADEEEGEEEPDAEEEEDEGEEEEGEEEDDE